MPELREHYLSAGYPVWAAIRRHLSLNQANIGLLEQIARWTDEDVRGFAVDTEPGLVIAWVIFPAMQSVRVPPDPVVADVGVVSYADAYIGETAAAAVNCLERAIREERAQARRLLSLALHEDRARQALRDADQ